MRSIALAAWPILLAGCGPQAESSAPIGATEPAAPAVPTLPSPPAPQIDLPGEYRVAGVDGVGIDLPYGVTASITGDRIHVTADCLNFAWTYTMQGARIATARTAVEGCARGLTDPEEAVVEALDAAATLERTPTNGIELRGDGRSVVLYAQ